MKVDRIYYYADDVTKTVVNYLKKHGFKGMEFCPLTLSDLGHMGGRKKGLLLTDELAIMLWGQGDQHGASYFFGPQRPYSKTVWDAHGDFVSISDELDGSNHNLYTLLDDPYVVEVEVLGCAQTQGGIRIAHIALGERIVKPVNQEELQKKFESKPTLESSVKGVVLHGSVDLDVIHSYPCTDDIRRDDGGNISLVDVNQSLDMALTENDMVRFDVGGLSKGVLKGWGNYWVRRKGMQAYKILIETCLSHS